MSAPRVIPGWIGWGNTRIGIEVYGGTSGDRFTAKDGGPVEGPTLANYLDPDHRGEDYRGHGLEGSGVIVVVLPERLIGNAKDLRAWADRVATAIHGEVDA